MALHIPAYVHFQGIRRGYGEVDSRILDNWRLIYDQTCISRRIIIHRQYVRGSVSLIAKGVLHSYLKLDGLCSQFVHGE